MILIACVDDKMGMLFNKRRQSMDSVLRRRVLNLCAGKKLWMNVYSCKQFDSDADECIIVDEDFMDKADSDDYCFAENINLAVYESKINRIILYKWNRIYPANLYFDINLKNWRLTESTDFVGSSHDKITEEIYVK